MSSLDTRIAQVDVLRGAALFGILVVNILVFAFSSYGGSLGQAAGGVLSSSLAFVVSAVFELKFYLMFSFLFGTASRCSSSLRGVRGVRSARGCFAGMRPCLLSACCMR